MCCDQRVVAEPDEEGIYHTRLESQKYSRFCRSGCHGYSLNVASKKKRKKMKKALWFVRDESMEKSPFFVFSE